MCFGSKKQEYNAYESGDYQRWLDAFNSGNGPLADELEQRIRADPNANMDMREVKRQRDVSTGKQNIDTAFSQFDSNYYDKYKNDYTDFYFPQIDQQYADSVAKLTAALAGRGTLESTVGADALAKLSQENDKVRTGVANEAQDAANKLRANVEQSKSSLYSLNESSADPQGINARAVGEATALVAPPAYSPLGQVFAAFLEPFASGVQAAQNASYTPYKSVIGIPSGSGSGTVVR